MKKTILMETIFVMSLILFAFYIGIQTLGFSGKFSPDSVIYIDMAENIAHGEGLSTSLSPVKGRHDELPIPVTAYAPLYPTVIALGLLVGFDAASFALLVSTICLALFLIVSYLTIRQILGVGPAMFGTALLPVFGPIVVAAESAWSETLGLTLLMFSFWCLAKTSQEKGLLVSKWIFLAGLSAGLAYTARYALLPLALVSGLWLTVVSWQRCKNLRHVAINDALFSLGWAIISLPVSARNLYYASNIRGGKTGGSTGTSIIEALSQLSYTAKNMSPYSGLVAEVAWIATTLLILTSLWLWTRRQKEVEVKVEKVNVNWSAVFLLTLWSVTYLVFLVYAKTQTVIDPLGDRLVLPTTTIILLLGGSALAYTCRFPKAPTCIIATALMCLSVWQVGTQAHSILEIQGKGFKNSLQNGQKTPEDMAFLKEEMAKGDLVIAQDGLFVPFFIRRCQTVYFQSENLPTAEDLTSYQKKNRQTFLVLRKHNNKLVQEKKWELIFQNQDSLIFIQTERSRLLAKN